MAKLHTKKKGKSGSRKVRGNYSWVELSPEEIENIIVDLHKSGMAISQIGHVLRDQHAVPSVKQIVKKSTLKIIESKVGKIEYPEDLMNLLTKAVGLRKHLVKHTRDVHNKTKLGSIEAKIRRLGKYYVREEKLVAGWRYDPKTAALLVR